MKKEDLIGSVITSLKIADDKMAIKLTFEDKEFIVKCDADCCSHTWIEHIEMCDLPAKIVSIQNLDLEREDNSDGEFIQFYGCKIITDKGEIVIDYRNSSNGYYGGNLSWGDEYFYGGVGQGNVSTEIWIDVKGDI